MRRAVVVKLGSSTLVDRRGRPRRALLRSLVGEIAALSEQDVPVCVVSSGAIALGAAALGRGRPVDVPGLQAASAVGQGLLLGAWQRALHAAGLRTGQVLLTASDIHARTSYLNARATLETMLGWGVVPVVNENDSTATDEITFGDNDALAAQVAVLLRARLLVLLTDQDGVYTHDPRVPGAELVREVRDHALLSEIDVDAPSASGLGSGGMRSKIVAAEMASAGGVSCVIARGDRPNVLTDAVAGRSAGTRFHPDARPAASFELWLRYGRPSSGRLTVDAGAKRAVEQGASLLAVGLRGVEGRFRAGDAVTICGPDGTPFAKGLAAADAADLRRAAGRRSSEAGLAEAVHRDYLAVHGDRNPDVSARARAAARQLASIGRARKDAALEAIAARIELSADAIREANELDLADARAADTSAALLDRLMLDAARIAALATAVRAVALLADPVGDTVTGWRLPNGLDVQKVRIPLGVLLVVYEARPNVTADVAALAIKSGNACILRGSSSARRTNAVLIDAVRAGLEDAGLPADSVVDYACSRDELAAFVADVKSCDVVIPRGGEQLKDFLMAHARVPVLVAAGGNCHVYLDASADPQKALEIIVNAKTQRPGVCNAAETLLVHRAALPALAAIGVALRAAGVELRADADAAEALGVASLPATEDDWATEYLDLVLAIRTVDSVEQAIDHIETYSTGHSEAIVTEDLASADAFIQGIGSACVYVNASTRFTDGGEFGFGAEIANSTSRLHARGPIGLADVTTTKYVVRGSGQIRQ